LLPCSPTDGNDTRCGGGDGRASIIIPVLISARDDYETGILLDANENSFGTPLAPSSLGQWPAELERYPDPHQKDLKALIGAFRGVQPGNIFVGVGSDESIDLLIRVFCVPGRDSILVSPPTYGMYKVAAATNDVGVVAVPLTPAFDIEADKIIQATKDNAAIKLVFVCTPNNPAAKDVQHAHIVRLLQGITSAVVVVDEAYVDFSELPSMAPLVNTYPNLVVLQTLSKSFGLAGIRLGTSFGSPELIAVLNKVKAPYNVNKLTQALGTCCYCFQPVRFADPHYSDQGLQPRGHPANEGQRRRHQGRARMAHGPDRQRARRSRRV